MKLGRPTLYNEQILIDTNAYIDLCVDGYEVIERPSVKDGKLSGMEDHRIEKVKIPTIEGLAVYLNINKDTIYTWRKEHEVFSELIEKLLAKQVDTLISNGLGGNYNPVIAKVLLAKHGYRDSQEITGKDGKDLIPDKEIKDKIDIMLASFLNGDSKDTTGE